MESDTAVKPRENPFDKEPKQVHDADNEDDQVHEANSDGFNGLVTCDSDWLPISTEAVKKLADGITNTFLPEAEGNKKKLDELLLNQSILLETVQQENAKFTDCSAFAHVTDMMNKAQIYHSKLIGLKREMNNLQDRTNKLRRRSVKLQQQRQKELLQLEQKREKELEHEQQLMARKVRIPSKTKGGNV